MNDDALIEAVLPDPEDDGVDDPDCAEADEDPPCDEGGEDDSLGVGAEEDDDEPPSADGVDCDCVDDDGCDDEPAGVPALPPELPHAASTMLTAASPATQAVFLVDTLTPFLDGRPHASMRTRRIVLGHTLESRALTESENLPVRHE